ncbi:MAG: hypothetical protein Q7U40_12985 [Desulfatirhabdiaceae bacterium]|nr:hypothetical protein [Desulfatirhabdiaceae bacterium]
MKDSWINGNVDVGFLPARQISGLVKDILSVKGVFFALRMLFGVAESVC